MGDDVTTKVICALANNLLKAKDAESRHLKSLLQMQRDHNTYLRTQLKIARTQLHDAYVRIGDMQPTYLQKKMSEPQMEAASLIGQIEQRNAEGGKQQR